MEKTLGIADKDVQGGRKAGSWKRSGFDRRLGLERREIYDISYLTKIGHDRRTGGERRKTGELRAGWVRVNQWSSVCVKEIPPLRHHTDEPTIYTYEIR